MNRMGSVTYSILFLLFLSFAGTLAAAGILIREYSRQIHICRDGLVEALDEIEKGVQKILDLNPTIARLQLEREELDREKLLAPDPASRAFFEALIIKNQIQQMGMVKKQKIYKTDAINKANGRIRLLHQKLNKEFSKHSIPSISNPKLMLKPEFTRHIAKEQSRTPYFTRAHELLAYWQLDVKKLFIDLPILKPLGAGNITIRCKANIRIGRNNEWYAQLTR